MARVLLRNGRLICPFTGVDRTADVLVEDGRIAAVGHGGGIVTENAEVLDLAGKIISPGFVDLHTHLREPGEEHKETIATAVEAALAGGFTTVCAMPNTQPALDSRITIETVARRSEGLGVRVLPIGAITVGRRGEQLAPLGSMAAAGAVAFSDDGSPVSDAGLMRRALEYSRPMGLPIVTHAEELALSAGGSMHEGAVSARLGVRGIPAAAEEVMVRRDVALAEMTGGRLHVAHVSTVGAVDAIREAKRRGVAVTAEATPHHLALTDEWVAGWEDLDGDGRPPTALGERAYDTSTKVNPPLRSRDHVEAVIEGVRDGTIDAIATDHAPHSPLEKECEYGCGAFGISGLETALGLAMTLVGRGAATLPRLVALLTSEPARAFGLPPQGVREGARAELVVFDPEREWVVDPSRMASRGRNTPLDGHRLRGRVLLTIAGERVWRSPELEAR